MVTPIDAFPVIAGASVAWDEFARRVWNAIQNHNNTTEPDIVPMHASFDYLQPSASAAVLNSAMPVIDNWLKKIIVLQPRTRPGETSRPIDPSDGRSTTTDAMAAVRNRLNSWLGV